MKTTHAKQQECCQETRGYSSSLSFCSVWLLCSFHFTTQPAGGRQGAGVLCLLSVEHFHSAARFLLRVYNKERQKMWEQLSKLDKQHGNFKRTLGKLVFINVREKTMHNCVDTQAKASCGSEQTRTRNRRFSKSFIIVFSAELSIVCLADGMVSNSLIKHFKGFWKTQCPKMTCILSIFIHGIQK